MNFYEHETGLEYFRKTQGVDMDWKTYYPAVLTELAERALRDDNATSREHPQRGLCTQDHQVTVCAGVEHSWYQLGRPYYKIYPAIIPALVHLNQAITHEHLKFDKMALSLRFAEVSPLTVGKWRCESVLAGIMPLAAYIDDELQWFKYLVVMPTVWNGDKRVWDGYTPILMQLPHANGEATQKAKETTLGESLDLFVKTWLDQGRDVEELELVRRSVILTAMVGLLDKDESLISADVLSKDLPRWYGASEEQRQVMEERAKRRGKVGWVVGREYEVCPHFRRPHFAVRHTGEGRKIPKVVAVKSSIVHRTKITTVPSGKHDEEGRAS